MRTTWLRLLVGLVTGALLLTACDGDGALNDDGQAEPIEGPTIRIRGQQFAESITIAEVYGQYLETQGYDVEILEPAGFRTEAFDDLASGELNFIVDYIGGAQTHLLPDAQPSDDPDEVIETIQPALDEMGVSALDYSEAANHDAMVVRGDSEAEQISDLADGGYVLGAAAHCFERPQCYLGFTDPDVYGIEFEDTVTIEFGPLLGEALAAEEVDVVMWSTTAPQIEQEGFRILEDDEDLFPAQNIAPMVSDELVDAYGEDFLTAVNALSALITTQDLVEWNEQTDIEFRESDEVAADWLENNDIR